ncbi:PR-1-like protein [Viridothelium virens]|uniref:PR-1-like protein n=1 Tax=Viridothelium virens TaxID=1048519 RepID=A0A6A6H698_VIRVR|nr:PR-1-like protein [Viridothelium virens]
MPSESKVAIALHNEARKEYGLASLQWSPHLAAQAKIWAKELARKGVMQHSDAGGENLYWSSDNADFAAAVNCWLDEKTAYQGEKIGEGNFGEWGHYSQCMWHSTTYVGMGKAKGDKGTFIVARYDPKGNISGEKPFGN